VEALRRHWLAGATVIVLVIVAASVYHLATSSASKSRRAAPATAATSGGGPFLGGVQPQTLVPVLTGGSTALTLDPGTVDALSREGVSVTAVAPAMSSTSGGTTTVTVPVNGGEAYVFDTRVLPFIRGDIVHTGGLAFRAGGRSVTASDFVINPGTSILNADLGGREVPLFDLDGRYVQIGQSVQGAMTIQSPVVLLSAVGARELNAALGTSAFTPGRRVGTAGLSLAAPDLGGGFVGGGGGGAAASPGAAGGGGGGVSNPTPFTLPSAGGRSSAGASASPSGRPSASAGAGAGGAPSAAPSGPTRAGLPSVRGFAPPTTPPSSGPMSQNTSTAAPGATSSNMGASTISGMKPQAAVILSPFPSPALPPAPYVSGGSGVKPIGALPLLAGRQATISLDPGALQGLSQGGVAVSAAAPATAAQAGGATAFTLPVTGGEAYLFPPDDLPLIRGDVFSAGGLTFAAKGRSVTASDLIVNPGTSVVTATIAGKQSPLFYLDGHAVRVGQDGSGGVTVEGVGVELAGPAADALNTSLDVSAFRGGVPIGSARLALTPAS
jgi:hypothetical protein